MSILRLDEEPVLFLAGETGANEGESAFESSAVQVHLHMPVGEGLLHALRRVLAGEDVVVRPLVPNRDAAGSVLPFLDLPFESGIVEGMVFDLHREPFHGRVHDGFLGHGPTLEHSVHFETQIIMEVGGVMLLNHKDGTRRGWVVSLHMEIIGPGDAKRIV